jgi:probable addiction module antidote protein
MAKSLKKYQDSLYESLKDPKEAAHYLNVCLSEDDIDSDEIFLMALRDVAMAHGFSDIAAKANLGRESLYKALSAEGNPKLETLRALLKAIGLRLMVSANEDVA